MPALTGGSPGPLMSFAVCLLTVRLICPFSGCRICPIFPGVTGATPPVASVFPAIFRQWGFRAKLIFSGSSSGSRGCAGFRLKSGGKAKPSSRILVFFVDWNFDGTAPQNTTWCCCIAPPKWGNFAIASVAFPRILVDCNLRAWGGAPSGLRFRACFSGHTGVIPPETQKILVVFWRSKKCACFGGRANFLGLEKYLEFLVTPAGSGGAARKISEFWFRATFRRNGLGKHLVSRRVGRLIRAGFEKLEIMP